MKHTNIALIFAFALILSAQAFAMDLAQGRAQGLVGEKLDGYVAAISAAPEAQALANEVNVRRREEYLKISKQNGQPASVVSKVAAESIIKGLPAGSLYQGADGSWKKR